MSMKITGLLQTAVKRREAKSKGEKERYKHLNAEFQREIRKQMKNCIRKNWLGRWLHKQEQNSKIN